MNVLNIFSNNIPKIEEIIIIGGTVTIVSLAGVATYFYTNGRGSLNKSIKTDIFINMEDMEEKKEQIKERRPYNEGMVVEITMDHL